MNDDMGNGGGDDRGYWRLLERIVIVYGLLLALALGVGLYAWSQLHERAVVDTGMGMGELLAPPPAPPAPTQIIEGARARAWFGPEGGFERGMVWASAVIGLSTEYTQGQWGARQVLGLPDVHPERVDHPKAWASAEESRGPEWLEVSFEKAAPARAIVIAETHNPGAIARIDDLSDPAAPAVLWRAESAPLVGAGRVLLVELASPRAITKLRVVLDTTRVAGWNEVDAIGLLVEDVAEANAPPLPRSAREAPVIADALDGARLAPIDSLPAATWATAVAERSSEYSARAWSAERALGPPDVWPRWGDDSNAWAQAEPDAGYEWITVRVPKTRARSIVIVETLRPGAVVRVDDMSDPAAPVALWMGRSPAQQERRVLVVQLPAPREIVAVRVMLDTRLSPGWNELDAIGLLPAR